MKKLIILSLLLVSIDINAGDVNAYLQYNARSGDTKLDLQLKDINIKASVDVNNFMVSIGREYDVPVNKVNHLMIDYNFTPADTYMTLSISRLANRSIHDVAHAFKNNRHKGWGYVAKQMGIKPGSKEFHALKKGTGRESEKTKGHGKHDKHKNKKKDKKKGKK